MAENQVTDTDVVEESAADFDTPDSKSGGNSAVRWVVIIVIIAIIIIGGLWLISKYSKFNVLNVNSTNAEWQAVFLTNGQVYFGKVAKETNDTLTISDIYYLQITQPLQESAAGSQQQPAQNELALVKLGNELHGPKDEMHINKFHILFMENLKDDSKVVQAIEESVKQAE